MYCTPYTIYSRSYTIYYTWRSRAILTTYKLLTQSWPGCIWVISYKYSYGLFQTTLDLQVYHIRPPDFWNLPYLGWSRAGPRPWARRRRRRRCPRPALGQGALLQMYIYIHTYIYTYIYTHIHIHNHIYIYTCLHIDLAIYPSFYLHIYVFYECTRT